MEYLSLIQSRFSVRNFSGRTVREDDLREILSAGRLAPTAKNFQPQRIYVLKSPEALSKVRSITKSAYNAPIVLMVCSEDASAWVNPITGRNSGQMDASIVTTHMMLRATDLGLGSVWVCWVDTEALKRAFMLPEGIEPYCLLPLGYPADDCTPNPRHYERKPLEETVFER
ncbi:MAG TPA: nitroreductase family protein [Candidatus Izemoplasmatales bacterium]|nr:nitroreductase family protein [Bacillota bacterium]HRY77774.1 nitroreductase family protein [Candidatus Izemoplasmatales bacterium]